MRNISSWKDLNIVYSPGQTTGLKNYASYSLGEVIHFSEKGNAQKYLRGGWSSLEPDHCWTEGKQSRIILYLQQSPRAPLLLSLYGNSMLAPGQKQQEVKVFINNHKVAVWQIKTFRKVFGQNTKGTSSRWNS